MAPSHATALRSFTPTVREWFTRAFDRPTEAQAQAWPAIATGEHVLISAPTGSGKTLAAVLWGVGRRARPGGGPPPPRSLTPTPPRPSPPCVHRGTERGGHGAAGGSQEPRKGGGGKGGERDP